MNSLRQVNIYLPVGETIVGVDALLASFILRVISADIFMAL